MKERPILFSAPMVRAILAGDKTQTRRIIKRPPNDPHHLRILGPSGAVHYTRPEGDKLVEEARQTQGYRVLTCAEWLAEQCAHGRPGDRLWVRETCQAEELDDGSDGVRYTADDAFIHIRSGAAEAEDWHKLFNYRGQQGAVVPSIHMPRWASRILLEVTGVRVERLQDISSADAVAEGTLCHVCGDHMDGRAEHDCHCFHTKARPHDFRLLWESINGADSWQANPWVWVVEFRRIKP